MMKKLLFYLVLMIFGITGVAGACLCHPPDCPEDWDFRIWQDEGINEEQILTKGVAVPFSFNIKPDFNPNFDEINSAWIAYSFVGTPYNLFLGKSEFNGDGDQWGVGFTNTFERALMLQPLWGDPLATLRTTGMLSGDFKALWCGDKTLELTKAYLFAKGCDNPVPEPATLLLLGSGLIAFAGIGRKKFFKKKKK